MRDLLERMFPRLKCKRVGHNWCGAEFMGPHRGDGGGIFYGLRYRLFCRRCRGFLDTIPEKEWPKDDDKIQ